MDELALFFGDEPSSKETKAPVKTASTKPVQKNGRLKINLARNASFNSTVIRNNSDPSFSTHEKPSSIHTSDSFPAASSLPLDLPPEPEEGNIEYKLKLINPTLDRLEHLMTQMKWRLNEGGGQAIYRLGVDDNGAVTGLTASEMSASLLTVYSMSQRIGADLRLLRECTITKDLPASELSPLENANPSLRLQRKAIELHAKWKSAINEGLPDLRIAMLGSVAVGKSTLLGILTDGEMDNGRGRARLNLFRHLHEVQSGRTSSLSSELIGFDSNGRLVNRRRSQGQLNKRTVDEVIRDSSRLVTLLDLAGHSKYQRTTLSGLTAHQPAFCVLVVSATTGLTSEGLCHARVATALGLPLAVVLSKIDLTTTFNQSGEAPPTLQRKISVATAARICVNEDNAKVNKAVTDLRQSILEELRAIKYYSLGDADCKLKIAECFKEDPPVFAVSSVSGFGLSSLLNFLAAASSNPDNCGLHAPKIAKLAQSSTREEDNRLVECWITKVFGQVPGVDNPVLEVLVKSGEVHENQRLWLGPDEEGHFQPVRVIELRHNLHPHFVLTEGQLGSLVAVSEETSEFPITRRGMVMLNAAPCSNTASAVAPSLSFGACWSLELGDIVWMPSGGNGCCPHVNSTVGIHAGNVVQYARILEFTLTCERHGELIQEVGEDADSALMQLGSSHKMVVSFLRQPEFLKVGRQVVVSVNNVAKAVGTISSLRDHVTTFYPPTRFDSTAVGPTNIANGSIPWQAVAASFEPASSYEDLLRRVGIDPAQATTFIGEPPLPPDLLAAEDISSLTQRNKRRQRNSKRRRKARLLAAASEVASSTTTWNSCSNGSMNLRELDMATDPPPSSVPSRQRRRKRKHRR